MPDASGTTPLKALGRGGFFFSAPSGQRRGKAEEYRDTSVRYQSTRLTNTADIGQRSRPIVAIALGAWNLVVGCSVPSL